MSIFRADAASAEDTKRDEREDRSRPSSPISARPNDDDDPRYRGKLTAFKSAHDDNASDHFNLKRAAIGINFKPTQLDPTPFNIHRLDEIVEFSKTIVNPPTIINNLTINEGKYSEDKIDNIFRTNEDGLDYDHVIDDANKMYALYLTSVPVVPHDGINTLDIDKLKAILVFNYNSDEHCIKIEYLGANQIDRYPGAGTRLLKYFINMIKQYVDDYNKSHDDDHYLRICLLSLQHVLSYYLKQGFFFDDPEDKEYFYELFYKVNPVAAEEFKNGTMPSDEILKTVCEEMNASYFERFVGPRDGARILTQSQSQPDGGAPHTKTKKNKPYNRAKKTKKYKNGKNGKNYKKHNICKRAKKTKKYKNCKRTKKL